jgi:hypothetical protein
VGRAGREFNYHYLKLAGLRRTPIRAGGWEGRVVRVDGNCWVDNVMHCRPPGNRKPTNKEIEACGGLFLPVSLERAKPEIVVLMGGTACSLVEGGVDLESEHGLLVKRRLCFENNGPERWIMPVYHPALGLHDATKIRHLREDFKALGRVLNVGEEEWEEEEYGGRCEVGVWKGEKEALVAEDGVVAVDTESVVGKLWSWQWSGEDGVGWMAYKGNEEAGRVLQHIMNQAREVVMHFAEEDTVKLRANGFVVEWGKVVDTQHMAYHRGLPQGLKALGRRLLGMKMRSYQDLVVPHSKQAVKLWLVEGMEKLPKIPVQLKTKVRMEKNPLESVLWRLFRHCDNETYDVWEAWEKACGSAKEKVGEWVPWLMFEMGDMPEKGIDKVPEGEAVEYAVKDAVVTRLVKGVMESRSGMMGVEEGDCR